MNKYSVYLEPVENPDRADGTAYSWVARFYEGDNAEEQFGNQKPYVNHTTVVRTCLGIVEAKGLSNDVTHDQFIAFMRALHKTDPAIEIVQMRRHGEIEFYDMADSRWN